MFSGVPSRVTVPVSGSIRTVNRVFSKAMFPVGGQFQLHSGLDNHTPLFEFGGGRVDCPRLEYLDSFAGCRPWTGSTSAQVARATRDVDSRRLFTIWAFQGGGG